MNSISLHRRAALLGLGGAVLLPSALASTRVLAQATPEEYVPLMLEAGAFTKTLAEIALEKGSADLVKRFAELEIGEVNAIEAVLAPFAGGAAPKPDGSEAEILARMREMGAGMEFDVAFVDAQITGHEEALGIQQPLSDTAEITVPVATAKLAEESIKSHLAMLNVIKASLG